MQAIRDLINIKKHITQQLENAIFAKMEEIAKDMNLDDMLFCAFGNRYRRNGKEIECKRLEKLDTLYCEQINEYGFEAIWEKGEGWV